MGGVEDGTLPAACDKLPVPEGLPESANDDLRVRCKVATLFGTMTESSITIPVIVGANALFVKANAVVVGRAPDPVTSNNEWSETIPLFRRFDLSVAFVAGGVLPL